MGQTWCRFSDGQHEAVGLLEDGVITEIAGSQFGEYQLTSRRFAQADVRLLVPVIPGNFYAIGSNYRSHVLERGKSRDNGPVFYEVPRVGYRANSALIATGENIVKPSDSGPNFQYEGELVAVIGKRAKNVTPEEADACIFGWTIGNDVTERDWQKNDPTNMRGKNADTFKPMGPWIVTGIEPSDMTTKVRLNGEEIHNFATGNMLFSPGEVISAISRYNTLHPGDVVWLGTDELPRNLVPGDRLDIEISHVGILSNQVVAEYARPMKIIDSQVHIWEALPADKAEEGERTHFTTQELLAEMDAAGVDGAILVPRSFAGANNDYAIAAAAQHPDRLAVMGRVSMDEAVTRPLLAHWREQPGMLGVRLTFHHKQDRGGLTDGTSDWFWSEAERLAIPVMIHAPEGLAALSAIAGRHPGLKIIIDHMGFARADMDEYAATAVDRLLPLAERPNIYVKVSCAPVYSTEPFPYANIQSQIRRVVDAFGSQRCFWGSDLTRLPADVPYRNCVEMFTRARDFLSPEELSDVMGAGLARCLGWRLPPSP